MWNNSSPVWGVANRLYSKKNCAKGSRYIRSRYSNPWRREYLYNMRNYCNRPTYLSSPHQSLVKQHVNIDRDDTILLMNWTRIMYNL